MSSLTACHTQMTDFTIFTDSQEVMRRILDDWPGPGQAVAARIIELATDHYDQGNTVTLRWVHGQIKLITNQNL